MVASVSEDMYGINFSMRLRARESDSNMMEICGTLQVVTQLRRMSVRLLDVSNNRESSVVKYRILSSRFAPYCHVLCSFDVSLSRWQRSGPYDKWTTQHCGEVGELIDGRASRYKASSQVCVKPFIRS